MAWAKDYSRLPNSFDHSRLTKREQGNFGWYEIEGGRLWGDQEYITHHLGAPGKYIKPMKGIVSYKYHCKQGLPDGARVVCFHGNPKPAQVKDRWVIESRSTAIPA